MLFECKIFLSEIFFDKNLFSCLVVFWKIRKKIDSNVWLVHEFIIEKYETTLSLSLSEIKK